MKRDHDGHRLWSIVAATVRPFPGRKANPLPPVNEQGRSKVGVGKSGSPTNSAIAAHTPIPPRLTSESTLPTKGREGRYSPRPPDPIEPNRFHRLTRSRAPAAPTVDLHNLNQDRARAALTAFVMRAHAEGERAVLVITGKGALGDGVLRRRAPEWLAEPPLRGLVAGLSEAHRGHGGEGAIYVALKRR